MQFKKNSETGGTSGKHFVKLKDKESIVGVFRGDPYDFRQHWVGSKSQVCTGTDCAECAKKNKAGFRFRLNFITRDPNGKFVAQIFEQGWNVYENLRSLHESDYDLERTILRITRNGVEKQTSYTIVPVPKHAVTDEMNQEFLKIKLHDLVNLEEDSPTQAGNGGADAPPPHTDDDIPW